MWYTAGRAAWTNSICPISHKILTYFTQAGKDYLTVRQISVSLTARHSTADMLKKLMPWLGESLQVYHGPASIYIGQKRSPAELILQRVQQHPGSSPKQLGLGLPLSKRNYITALNDLLDTGTVVCTFKDNHMPMLHLSSHAPAQGTSQASAADDRLAFHTAYNAVGRGCSFVRIHRLCDALPWPHERNTAAEWSS
jgi:hypothetical protein